MSGLDFLIFSSACFPLVAVETEKLAAVSIELVIKRKLLSSSIIKICFFGDVVAAGLVGCGSIVLLTNSSFKAVIARGRSLCKLAIRVGMS